MRIGEKTRFARIWPNASKIGFFFCEPIRAKHWCANRLPTKGPSDVVSRARAGVCVCVCVCVSEDFSRARRVNFAQNEGHEKATKKAQTLFF